MSRYYLTTPIYYVNDAPHIGHAYTTIIADAVTRWHRLMGDETHFLTGTDEHGLKVQQTADNNGVTPQEWADRTVVRFQDAWKLLNIANDDFIRTTEPRHYAAVAKLLQACYDAGDIELGTYKGYYSVSDEEYITADEVADYEARGRKIIEMEEPNYFFRLSRFADRLLQWYADHPDAIQPEGRRNEVLGFIRGGLQDFSISRTSLKWGIPLPWDPAHVTYVWFDALTNYITAVGYGDESRTDEFAKWWPGNHIIGKDIIRFHCVYWPAMLMSAGIEPPANWYVHGWLLVGGEKMSKTRLNQIAPSDLVADFGVDGFRYHFLADCPMGPDSDFSYEGMVARYNSDLANNLGNLTARVATVVDKKCGGVGPAPDPSSSLAAAAAEAYDGASRGWLNVAPSEALEATWRLIRATNAYLEANEPWKAEPGPAVDKVMGDALEALRIVTVLVQPAVPDTAQEIWRRIGMPGLVADQRLPQAAVWGGYPGGVKVEKGAPLFPRK
ncbi:MAG: class I tRNA ligase family protein [Acidimicrobiia bacterium]